MMFRVFLRTIVLILSGVAHVPTAFAEEVAAATQPGAASPAAIGVSPAREPIPERDPFSTSGLMAEEAQRRGSGLEFYPAQEMRAVPRLILRGFVEDETHVPIALLEVDQEGVYLVRAGDTISIQHRGASSVLKVQKITNLSVFVEVGSLGQVIVVR
jgi:hypothetical protein